MAGSSNTFYLRYYSGHQGRFGHEFLEFDFRVLDDGKSASMRYANNSNYRNDSLIRKEMCISSSMVDEIKRIIKTSEVTKENDDKWPEKNKDGRQELEIVMGNEHISFATAKIGSLVDVTDSADPEGLRVFYYLVQDLKALVFSLIALHFKGGSLKRRTKPKMMAERWLTKIDQAYIENHKLPIVIKAKNGLEERFGVNGAMAFDLGI